MEQAVVQDQAVSTRWRRGHRRWMTARPEIKGLRLAPLLRDASAEPPWPRLR